MVVKWVKFTNILFFRLLFWLLLVCAFFSYNVMQIAHSRFFLFRFSRFWHSVGRWLIRMKVDSRLKYTAKNNGLLINKKNWTVQWLVQFYPFWAFQIQTLNLNQLYSKRTVTRYTFDARTMKGSYDVLLMTIQNCIKLFH